MSTKIYKNKKNYKKFDEQLFHLEIQLYKNIENTKRNEMTGLRCINKMELD